MVTRSSFPVLTSVAMAVAISRKREVRKKRSAGSAGTPVTDAEAAIGDHFILALQRPGAAKTARNNNDYGCNMSGFAAARSVFKRATRAILRVRFETGSFEKSSNPMLFAPRMRGIFATAIRNGSTITLR